MTTPLRGMPVLYQMTTGNFHAAMVAGNISGTTCDLVIFSHGSDWEDGGDPSYAIRTYFSKTEGTTAGTWQVNPAGLGPQGVQGPTGATGATGSTGATGPGALVTSTAFQSTTFTGTPPTSSARQVSTTKDVIVTASFKIDTTLSLTGGSAGTVRLLADASNPPTTEIARVASSSTGTLTVGLNLATSNTLILTGRLRPSDFYRFVGVNDTGTPTMTLVGGVTLEQIL